MIIYKPNGEALISIEVDDESYHFAEIMGRDDVTLYFSLPVFKEFPLGCYVEYMAKRYTLYSVDKMRMEHRRSYDYTITFDSEAVELDNYIFTNPNDGRFKFPLTASPMEHLSMLCACMSQKSGEQWTPHILIDSSERNISYDAMTCLDALSQIANAYETEYRVDGTDIYLGKVEFYKAAQDQILLSYGKGNGLRPGIEKTVDASSKVIGRVYIQGSDRNIDFSNYPSTTEHSATLLLPRARHIWYNGSTFSDSAVSGYTEFVTSEDGRFVSLAAADAPDAEGALDLTDIYPCYDHEVSSVEEVNVEDHFWDIYSDTFTAGESTSTEINYGECLIGNGQDMTIIFQTGSLAGREFGVKWKVSNGTAYMEIVPVEQDGYTMPDRDSGFYPKVNDVFRVFNCYLPSSYVLAAEGKMMQQAVAFLYENCKEKFSIKGEVDPIWSASRWVNIGDHFKPGAYFTFVDPTWQNDGVSIRITNVKTFINKPHMPIVELSNTVSGAGVASAIQKAAADANVLPEAFAKENKAYTRRTFQDVRETMEMLINAAIEGFSDAITPVAVQTMQLIAGSETLQFQFWTTMALRVRVPNPFTYSASTKQLSAISCVLQHMTLGIKDLKPNSSRSVTEYKRWSMSSYTSAVLDDAGKAYYVYAICNKNNTTGTFALYENAKKMDGDESDVTEDNGKYFFLCGILNSESDGDRSFAPMFGFTEILPGQITTDAIRSANGDSWWNLAANAFQLGEDLSYSPSRGLVLNNTLVVNGNGDEVALGAWCGEYDASHFYQLGDQVVWEDTSTHVISTYQYINQTSTKGNLPSNTNYWQVIAKGQEGQDGADGAFLSTAFIRTNSTPSTPSGGSYADPKPTTSGWSDSIPAGENILWASSRKFYSDDRAGVWSTPRQMTDTATFDVEFAKMQSDDATPPMPTDANRHGGSGTQIWFDPAQDTSEDFTSMYWRAERECTNGEWSGWTIVRIKGESGEDGRSVSSVVAKYYGPVANGSTPPVGVPESQWVSSLSSITPAVGQFIWTRLRTTLSNGTTSDAYYSTYYPSNGTDGNDGDPGPYIVYRSQYNSSETYYGMPERTDAVYYNGSWYLALTTAGDSYGSTDGSFKDKTPGNTTYWSQFMGNFANIATGLLLTERAFVKYLYAQELQTGLSPDDSDFEGSIHAADNTLEMYDASNKLKLLITGKDLADISANAAQYINASAVTAYSYNGSADTTSTLGTFSSVADAPNSVSFPSMTIRVHFQLGSEAVTLHASASYLIDGNPVSSGAYNGLVGASDTEVSFTIPAVNATLSPGSHTVSILLRAETPAGNTRLGYIASNSARIVLEYTSRVVEIGANGFRASFSSSSYAAFLDTTDSNNRFIIRNGNYGIRLSSTAGLQKSSNMNNSSPTWTNL